MRPWDVASALSVHEAHRIRDLIFCEPALKVGIAFQLSSLSEMSLIFRLLDIILLTRHL